MDAYRPTSVNKVAVHIHFHYQIDMHPLRFMQISPRKQMEQVLHRLPGPH